VSQVRASSLGANPSASLKPGSGIRTLFQVCQLFWFGDGFHKLATSCYIHSAHWLMGWALAIIVIVLGLYIWAILPVSRRISKRSQPFIDDLFGYPPETDTDKADNFKS
jgi:hypothetical protein